MWNDQFSPFIHLYKTFLFNMVFCATRKNLLFKSLSVIVSYRKLVSIRNSDCRMATDTLMLNFLLKYFETPLGA